MLINGSPIAEFVSSYQFDASDEGFVYTPTAYEQAMIEDAICSFIADGERLRAALTREVEHASDCAVHNEPAFPAGPCDCGAAHSKAREG